VAGGALKAWKAPGAAPPLGIKACRHAELGAANPDAVLELAADGSLICVTLTVGWKAFVSSTGFRLPDNPRLIPAAQVLN
jgi:hypothetical protein